MIAINYNLFSVALILSGYVSVSWFSSMLIIIYHIQIHKNCKVLECSPTFWRSHIRVSAAQYISCVELVIICPVHRACKLYLYECGAWMHFPKPRLSDNKYIITLRKYNACFWWTRFRNSSGWFNHSKVLSETIHHHRFHAIYILCCCMLWTWY